MPSTTLRVVLLFSPRDIAFPDSVKYKKNIQLIDKIDKLSISLYFIQSGNAIFGSLVIFCSASLKAFPNGLWERENKQGLQNMDFEIISQITAAETMAVNNGIRASFVCWP